MIEHRRNYSQCVIKNSEFHANHGLRTGGVFHFETKVVKIYNCTFIANEALLFGGVIYAFTYCTIKISNTTILQSFVAVGSHIFVQDSVTMIIEDSRFHTLRNFVLGGSLIFATKRCSITIARSQFVNQFKGPSYSIALNINNHSSIIVENSIFKTNNGLSVLLSANNTKVHFSNCSFDKISGFVIENQVEMNINGSRITNTINTLPAMALFNISHQSH